MIIRERGMYSVNLTLKDFQNIKDALNKIDFVHINFSMWFFLERRIIFKRLPCEGNLIGKMLEVD